MNLREQLRDILPEILSENPANSIKGTELIRLVKYRLHQDYSDATLRYHFSIMSCDPTSPIAKVERGQGYYLRTTTLHSLNSAANLIPTRQGLLGEGIALSAQEVDIALSRADKFRVIYCRHLETENRFPFAFETSFSQGNHRHNLWRFPDAVVLDWLVAQALDTGFEIHPELARVCRNSGSPLFGLTSLKMKLEVTRESLREDFFQCLSNSLWAHSGELVVAAALDDEKLVEDLRELANAFNLGITTYGLDAGTLDNLPEAPAIRSLSAREFEAILSRITLHRISTATPRSSLSWHQLTEIRQGSSDFAEMLDWISACLQSKRPLSYSTFRSQRKVAENEKNEKAAEQVVIPADAEAPAI
ncbi:MAG: hypothetical protein ACC661_02840, partial [Verrucomicrobiales bacterium]